MRTVLRSSGYVDTLITGAILAFAIQETELRIFVLVTGPNLTRTILCEVSLINPRRACAARVTVLGLCVCVCVCVCVCYSTSHFSRDYSCHK